MKSTNISRNERHQKCRTENELLSSMMSEYNQKIRNDKEKKFKESMYQTLRPKIQNEIYAKYNSIIKINKTKVNSEEETEVKLSRINNYSTIDFIHLGKLKFQIIN